MHKDHSCKKPEYREHNIHKPVKVYSYGVNGLTSKEIYDIQKAYDRQENSRKLLRKLSSYINGCPLDCKVLYRNTLKELVIEKNYKDSVSVLKYRVWNNNYSKDQQELYRSDGMHLNEYGYTVLDRAIATEIAKLILK